MEELFRLINAEAVHYAGEVRDLVPFETLLPCLTIFRLQSALLGYCVKIIVSTLVALFLSQEIARRRLELNMPRSFERSSMVLIACVKKQSFV
jgi:hypothetical protein